MTGEKAKLDMTMFCENLPLNFMCISCRMVFRVEKKLHAFINATKDNRHVLLALVPECSICAAKRARNAVCGDCGVKK